MQPFPYEQIEIITHILDRLDVRISYWSLDQICHYTNRAGLDWFGKHREQVIGRSAREVFGEILYEQNIPFFARASNGEAQTFQRKIVTPSGEDKYLLANYSPFIVDGQIRGVIISATDVTKLKKVEQELDIARQKAEGLATHDFLTGLPNRVLLYDRLKQSLALAKRTKTPVGLLTLDLDGFKQVNDTYGHQMGDAVLKSVAKRLLALSREADTVARVGGDEFVILMSQTKNLLDVEIFAKRILTAFNKEIVIEKQRLKVGVSIGIAVYPTHCRTTKTLLANSDKALYVAKRQGKNCYAIWGET